MFLGNGLQILDISEVVAHAKMYVGSIVCVKGILLNGHLVPDLPLSSLCKHISIQLRFDKEFFGKVRLALHDYQDDVRLFSVLVTGKLQVEVFEPFRGGILSVQEICIFRDGHYVICRPAGVTYNDLGLIESDRVTNAIVLEDVSSFVEKNVQLSGRLFGVETLESKSNSRSVFFITSKNELEVDVTHGIWLEPSQITDNVATTLVYKMRRRIGGEYAFVEDACVHGKIILGKAGSFPATITNITRIAMPIEGNMWLWDTLNSVGENRLS